MCRRLGNQLCRRRHPRFVVIIVVVAATAIAIVDICTLRMDRCLRFAAAIAVVTIINNIDLIVSLAAGI